MKGKPTEEIIEIYRIHVDLADKTSERRGKTNQYYVSLLSALLIGVGFYLKELEAQSLLKTEWFLVIASLLGIFLCIIWWLNIKSYRQLNSGKFMVLHELEEKLSFQFFKREWELLGEGKKKKKYFQLTRIEQYSPLIIAIPYLLLLIYSLVNIYK